MRPATHRHTSKLLPTKNKLLPGCIKILYEPTNQVQQKYRCSIKYVHGSFTVYSKNDRVTYFMNNSQPDPKDILVLPPRSSTLHSFNARIADLNSCSSCIHVVPVLRFITVTRAFIAQTGTATSLFIKDLNSSIISSSMRGTENVRVLEWVRSSLICVLYELLHATGYGVNSYMNLFIWF